MYDMDCVVFLIHAVCVIVIMTASASTAYLDCPSGFGFSRQPPSNLNCNPLGRQIRLKCSSTNADDIVTWHWTQERNEAGQRGIPVQSNIMQEIFQFDDSVMHLLVTVSESTMGYYWCEISPPNGVLLQPSSITPICAPIDGCLKQCIEDHVESQHNINPTCAELLGTNLSYSIPFLPECSYIPINLSKPLSCSSSIPLPSFSSSLSQSSSSQSSCDTATTTFFSTPSPVRPASLSPSLLWVVITCTLSFLLVVTLSLLLVLAAIYMRLRRTGKPGIIGPVFQSSLTKPKRSNHLKIIPLLGEDTNSLTCSHPQLVNPSRSKPVDSIVIVSPSVTVDQGCHEKDYHRFHKE